MKRVLAPVLVLLAVSALTAPAVAGRTPTDDGWRSASFGGEHFVGAVVENAYDDVVPLPRVRVPLGQTMHLAIPGEPTFTCLPGTYVFGGTNPLVNCTTSDGRVFVDYPPYGNATQKTMTQACATFSTASGTNVTTAPADCLPQVQVTRNGVATYSYPSLPFTMTLAR